MSESKRSMIDVASDTGASCLYGAMMGIEVEFDGNMAITGLSIDKALRKFMDDVTLNGGEELASVYAKKLMKTLSVYAAKGQIEEAKPNGRIEGRR